MATDGPTIARCDPEIFKNGESVLVVDAISSTDMDDWVRQVAAMSGQRVDWHYICHKANVLALGDIDKVNEAIQKLMPEYERLKKAFITRFARL